MTDTNGNAALRAADDKGTMARLEDHRRYLYRYARLHLRDTASIEDVVQETFLAALASPSGFAGRSQLGTWLTAILRNKIVDLIRRQKGTVPAGPFLIDDEQPEEADAPFTPAGGWLDRPASWGAPDKPLESKQFWRVFQACQQSMPARQALVFSLREISELSTEAICQIVGISASNCHTTLFRARLRLQRCLSKNWFGVTKE
jgi:RNA polymerase sigma-70 factor, ECF subfamily